MRSPRGFKTRSRSISVIGPMAARRNFGLELEQSTKWMELHHRVNQRIAFVSSIVGATQSYDCSSFAPRASFLRR